MPSHTVEERLRKTSGGIKRNIVAQGTTSNQNVLTRRGQVQDQTNLITPKALEQPFVKGRAPRTSLVEPKVLGDTPFTTITDKTVLRKDLEKRLGISPSITYPPIGPIRDLTKKRAALAGGTKRGKPVAVVAGGVKKTTGTGTLTVADGRKRIVSLTEDEKRDVMALKPGKGIGNFSIGRTTAEQENRKLLGLRGGKPGIFTAKGIESLFERLASPEFLAQIRRRRGTAAGIKGRRADIKSVNESINVLVKQLGTIPDFEDNDGSRLRITDQIDALSAIRRDLLSGGGEGRSGGGSRGGGANFDTPEGFAAFLASKNIPPEERLSLTRRLFANGP